MKRLFLYLLASLAVTEAALLVYGAVAGLSPEEGTNRFWPLSFVGLLVVGGYSILRRPNHRVGWALSGIGIGIGTALLSEHYFVPFVPAPVGRYLTLLGPPLVIGAAACVGLFFLWYPTGTTLLGRWRLIERSIIGFGGALALYYDLRPGLMFDLKTENPIGLAPLLPLRDSPVEIAFTVPFILLIASALASLVARHRGGTWTVRQQMRLVLYSAMVFLVGFLMFAVVLDDRFTSSNDPTPFVFILGLNGIAIGVGVAIARYRLYDVDRLVSRTVSYTLLIALLAMVFAAGMLWIPTLFDLGESPVLVAASTLAAAALFNPLRRRIHSFVDRRFNRSKYDAEHVVESFTGSLRDFVNEDKVVHGWLDVVSETMQPSQAAIWLR